MAYLLGSLSCMEALLEDVHDLQSVISEYVSCLGPLKCPSWKYPDKFAGDVNIDQLLLQYTSYLTADSSQEEDAKHVAHVALYELVIDRLVYLLHASGKFIIPLIASMKRPNNSLPLDISENLAGRNSVGLVVKQGWHLQKILQTCVMQMVGELRNKKQLIFELEEKKISSQKTCSPICSRSSPTDKTKSPPQNHVTLSPDGSLRTSMSKDEYSKSCQTVETSFLPCEACSVVQECSRCTGKIVLQLCQDLNLPSRLSRYMSILDSTKWMTATEVMQWTAEQNKDLTVIYRHVENTVKPLKASVESLEQKCSALQSQKKLLEKENLLERETQETIQKQSNNKLQGTIKAHQTAMNEITKEKANLESQLKTLSEKFELCKDTLQQVEKTNKRNEMELQRLTEKLKIQTEIASEVEQLKEQIKALEIQAEESEKIFFECNRQLNQEVAKNQSMAKHLESIQLKQRSTLNHIEKLNDENTDLQNQLAELQDSNDDKQEQIENLERQHQTLDQQIADNEEKMKKLSFQKEEMENSIKEMRTQIDSLYEELKKGEERENLLIQYPDLNGPVLEESLCSGNVMLDMELQIRANIARIELLENQNHTLRLTLKKMNERHELQPRNEEPNSQPVSVWNVDTTETRAREYYNRKSEEPGIKHNSWLSNAIEKNSNNNYSEKLSQKAKAEKSSTAASLQRSFSSTAMKNNSGLFRSKTGMDEKPSLTDTKPIERRCKTSSIKTYISLKQQGKLYNDNQWCVRGKSQPVDSEVLGRTGVHHLQTQMLTFVCQRCDKMYLEAKELKIHSLYCKD